MAKGPKYKLPFARRRNGKTDYKTRLALLKSRKQRLVVRASNKSIIVQIITYEVAGDKVLVSVSTKQIQKLGWKGNTRNLPIAYLAGFMCAKKAKKAKVTEAVLDIGFKQGIGGSILFAVLKGAIDGGMNIPHNESILPSEERIRGEHISAYAAKLKKEDKAAYDKIFSGYLKQKLAPEDMTKHFNEIKKKIETEK